MTADMQIVKLTTQLEEAGAMGLLAAGMLAPFLLANSDDPGVFSGTNTGFVWSKTLGGNARDEEIPFGIGKLKITGALFSANVGVELTDGLPSHINIMVALGEGGNKDVFLEIDPKVAVLADKIEDPLDPNPENKRVIGYTNPGAPLRIGIPLAAIEFTFHLDLFNGDIQSSMVMHESLSDFVSSQIGIFELDLNKVVVFPKLGDLGLYINDLFVDFTDSAATSFTKMFPEVYDPSWKGFGAQAVTLLYPVDKTPGQEEFISSSVEGFMYGIDNGFSGKFNVAYNTTDTTKWIGQAMGEIEIRNNDFLKSTVAVDLNVKKLIDGAEAQANAADLSEMDQDKQEFLEAIKESRADPTRTSPTPLPQASYVRFQLQIVDHQLAGEKVVGFELMMSDASIIGTKSSDGVGLDIDGAYAQAMFISLVFIAGVFLLKDGLEKDDTKITALATGLLLFSAADIILAAAGQNGTLPQLEKISLTQFGFRLINITPDQGPTEQIREFVLGTRFKFKLDGGLIGAIEWIANETGIVGAFNAGEIFGYDLENLDLGGYVDMGVNNVTLTDKAPPDHVGRLFERKNITLKAYRLPELHFTQQDATNGSAVVPKIEPVIKTREGGDTWYGLGVLLSPQTGPSSTLSFPAGGIVFYFYPDFDMEFVAQLAQKPGITYLIPEMLLAKGTFDINKPIPAFSGTQSRIAVDVGVWSALPKLGAGASTEEKAKRKKELLKVSNYKYQFGGEVAWGEATPADGPPDLFDFYYVQLGYNGKSPLVSIGALGFYGLDLIYGKNIAPGYPSGKPTALGIADWITQGPDPYSNVRDWPDTPSTDKWHPDITWDAQEQEFRDKSVAGLIIQAGSAGDGRKTFDIEALGLLGLDDFWLAVAAKTKIKPINLSATAVFAYDDGDWLFRLVATFKKNEDGSFIFAKFPVEFGSSSDPNEGWFYFGHYDKKHGGPAIVDIFSQRYVIKFFLVYNSGGLNEFGLMPFEDIYKPNIPGPAWGAGGLFQIGPKKYGPSFLNLKLSAAMGFNIAYRHDPTFLFGELYAGGYMQLKVVVIKFKLELLARLQGMAIEDADRWLGEISVKLNLPWPLSDVEETFDFIVQSHDFVPVPPAAPFNLSATALANLETRSFELLQETVPEVPIDSMIAFSIGRPINEIIHPQVGDPNGTTLYVNDIDPATAGEEMMETDYQGVKYVVYYRHVLRDLRISHRPIGGGAETVVENLLASWNLPVFDENGDPLEGQDKNQVLYLNGLMPPELQFNGEAIGTYNAWESSVIQVHPCQLGGTACIMDVEPLPNVSFSTVPQMKFDTFLGTVAVNGVRLFDDSPVVYPDNHHTLGWSNSGPQRIRLPYTSWVDMEYASRVQFSLGLLLAPEVNVEELFGVVSSFRVNASVILRGRPYAERLRFNIEFTPDANAPCGFQVDITNQNFDNNDAILNVLEAPCLDDQLAGMQISIAAANETELIESVRFTGYRTLLDPEFDWEQLGDEVGNVLDRLGDTELLLTEFCIERAQLNPGSWDVIIADEGSNLPGTVEEALDNLLNNHLFEPNREYTIDYAIETFAKTYTVDEDGGLDNENPGPQMIVSSTTNNDAGIEPIIFHTEAFPSQNVNKYVGFTFPSGRTQPVYPDSAVPIISLKYQGLIQNIFAKHYGSDVLNPRMVDINGNGLTPQQVGVIDIYSSPADQSLEDMLETCVPMAETMAHLQFSSWIGALVTEMDYSLQMVDSSDPFDPKTPVNISFKTSRYRSFADHVAAIAALELNGRQEAVTDSTAVATDIADFIAPMVGIDAPAYSFDGAIERFYRDILSRDNGRISNDPTKDSLTFIVALNPADPAKMDVWGVAIELTESLLNKVGVNLNVDPAFADWQDVGLYKTTDGYLILRDAAAGRMLILHTADGQTFTPFANDLQLGINFDAEQAVREEIEAYVALSYPDKDDAEQATIVDDAIAEIRLLDGADDALTNDSQTLTIPLPKDV